MNYYNNFTLQYYLYLQDNEYDDDDDDDDPNGVRNLIENLPAKLRQKALMGTTDDDDDDDDDVDEDEEDKPLERWGRKKTYWQGDTADLEIGQEFEDAQDEEEAAKVNNIYIIQ